MTVGAVGLDEVLLRAEAVGRDRTRTATRQTTGTLIVSDVHLGLPACRAAPLMQTLKGWRFDRLVLLGDIFHDLDFRRLSHDHWDFLSHIRKLSNPKRGVEVAWVLGNHDRKAAQVASHLMGVAVHETYGWEQDGRSYLAVHGDRFDRLLTSHPILSEIGGDLLSMGQRFWRLARRKSKSGGWMSNRRARWGLTGKVRAGAVALAADRQADVIFCGHTHDALHERIEVSGAAVEYVNTGCWTRLPSHYATVDAAGVRLHACR